MSRRWEISDIYKECAMCINIHVRVCIRSDELRSAPGEGLDEVEIYGRYVHVYITNERHDK